MLLVIVKRRPDPVTDKADVIIISPANAQDAMRIMNTLTLAQNTLIELTKRAVIDGYEQAEKLK